MALTTSSRFENELKQLENEIKQKEIELVGQKGQSKSISNDINIISKKIEKAKLDIKAKNIVITKLFGEIKDTEKTINELQNIINKEKESLSYLLKKTNEIDNSNFINILFEDKTLSEYYSDSDQFLFIKKEVKNSLDNINQKKSEKENHKEVLNDKRTEELGAKIAIEDTKKVVEQDERQKQVLLKESKQKEKPKKDINLILL